MGYSLDVSNKGISSLEGFQHFKNAGINSLYAQNNRLTQLQELSDGLQTLWVQKNILVNLPALPSNLQYLKCEENFLNVFEGDLKTVLESLIANTKTYEPQYRYIYTGQPVVLYTGQTAALTAEQVELQQSGRTESGEIIWETVDTANLEDFIFSSSDTSVAAVDSTGKITAAGSGSCTIYADYLGLESAFTRISVSVIVNEPPLAPPPVLVGAETNIDGTIITLAFDKAMSSPEGAHTQFTAIVDGVPRSFSAAALKAGDSTKIELTLDGSAIKQGQTISISYTLGTVQAADGGILQDFSNRPVENKALFAGGNGTEGSPYLIETPEQLNNIRYRLDAHFRLVNDIDLSDYLSESSEGYNEEKGWQPIGITGNRFSGTFDGNSKAIIGLFINRPENIRIGLFGYTSNSAVIKNIHIEDAEVTGDTDVGILVGNNWGEILNSTASGIVNGGEDSTGGLVGCNVGKIENCGFIGDVSSTGYSVGGLVGYNSGTVDTSYSSGNVTGLGDVGGLAGCNDEGTINNSYAMSKVYGGGNISYYGTGGLAGYSYGVITNSYSASIVTSNDNSGTLVGYNDGDIIDSYYDQQMAGQVPAVGYGNEDGVVGLDKDEMKQSSSFSGWDFNTIWTIEEGVSYPYFKWQDAPLTPPNTAPRRKEDVPATTTATVTLGGSFTINLSTIFEDAEDDLLYYKVSINDGEYIEANVSFSYTPTTTGTIKLVFKANDGTVDSSETYSVNLTVYSAGGGGGSITTPVAPTYKAIISGIGTTGITLNVAVNENTGNALIELEEALSKDIFTGKGTAVLIVPSIPNVNSYTLGIPVASLSGTQDEGALTFSTGAGSVTIPSGMLAGMSETEGKTAGITIGYGDKSSLPEEVKEAIGNRPIIQLIQTLDGVQTEWNNPAAPVTVTIFYTPAPKELENPESIVIWYIDGSGNVISVPNGRYDPATGTFTTTHFSYYAVGYRQVSFKDVAKDAWYYRAVSFIAARGITKGTGDNNFSPEAKLTRSQFLVMLMRTFGIAPDTAPEDNFDDAGDTWYTGYLAAAKRLGISAGVGSNTFAPGREITRQEMFTMLYNVLKVIGQMPSGDSRKTLTDFNDSDDIAPWARNAVKLLAESGIINGIGNRLLLKETTTRAQMAQVLYNLLSR